MTIQVTVDTSFLEGILTYFQRPSNSRFHELMQHPAAHRVHTHATQWKNTDSDLRLFWISILQREQQKGTEYHQSLQNAIDYIDANHEQLDSALTEVQDYLPQTLHVDCHLFLMLGYDIGIVSQGDALLNLGHPLFQKDSHEIIYFAMHEVSHVGYTQLHPFFTLEGLHSLDDLQHAIQYSTHLEGIAVYTPLQRRLNDQELTHEDYVALLNPTERTKRVHRFFDIYNTLMRTPNRSLQENDLEVFDIMSGQQQRLWYVTGAHMAQTIDKTLGRDTLIQTISAGPASFFTTYNQAQGVP